MIFNTVQHLDKLSNQHPYRKKHQRIRCPECSALSKVIKEDYGGWQDRVCRKGHVFHYSYTIEASLQGMPNYKSR